MKLLRRVYWVLLAIILAVLPVATALAGEGGDY